MSTNAYNTSSYALNELISKPDLSEEEFETNVKGITEIHKLTFGPTKTLTDFYNVKHTLNRQQVIGRLPEFVNQLSKIR